MRRKRDGGLWEEQAAVRFGESAQASRGGVVGVGAGSGRLNFSRETRGVVRFSNPDHATAPEGAQ